MTRSPYGPPRPPFSLVEVRPGTRIPSVKEPTVLGATPEPGFLLVDAAFHPLAFNENAVRILTFPARLEKIRHLESLLAEKIKSELVDRQSVDGPGFVQEFKSGKRRYTCRAFRIGSKLHSAQTETALLLERHPSIAATLSEASRQFGLTEREGEVVKLLLQDLTTKQIASRMKISPNTVKAFLRLVMVKMEVSTRAGIAGKIAEAQTKDKS